MGYNRTVRVICDLCGHLPEFPPGSEWRMRLRSLGDVWFLWHMWQCLWGWGIIKNENPCTNRMDKEWNDQD